MRHLIAAIALAGTALALPACREVHAAEGTVPARAVKVITPQPAARLSATRHPATTQPSHQVLAAYTSGGHADDIADLVAVPLAAIVRATGGGDHYVVFVTEGRNDLAIVRARTIALGRVTGNLVAVSGVHASDRVVVMGASLLQDGEAVRVMR
jgi:hypothetical protein